MTTIPQRYRQTNRQTDGQLALAIPRSARLRAEKMVNDWRIYTKEYMVPCFFTDVAQFFVRFLMFTEHAESKNIERLLSTSTYIGAGMQKKAMEHSIVSWHWRNNH